MENSNLYRVMQEYADDYGVTVSNDYSGRFMYGKTCVSVAGGETEIQKLFKAVLLHYHQSWIEADNQRMIGNDDADPISHTKELLDFLLVNYNTHSMGLGVVLYWPKWQHTEDKSDE